MKFFIKCTVIGDDLNELKSLRRMAEDMPDKMFRFDLGSEAFFDGRALEFLVGLANSPLKNVVVVIDSRNSKYKPNYFVLSGTNVNYVQGEVSDEDLDYYNLDDYPERTAVIVRVNEDIVLVDPYGYR